VKDFMISDANLKSLLVMIENGMRKGEDWRPSVALRWMERAALELQQRRKDDRYAGASAAERALAIITSTDDDGEQLEALEAFVWERGEELSWKDEVIRNSIDRLATEFGWKNVGPGVVKNQLSKVMMGLINEVSSREKMRVLLDEDQD